MTTTQSELVRRHLELHLERLEEWLTAQRRSLAFVEVLLASRVRSAGDRTRAAS